MPQETNPHPSPLDLSKDPNTIVLQKQADGNWKGWMKKGDKVLEAREINPEYCLQWLLTNEGK